MGTLTLPGKQPQPSTPSLPPTPMLVCIAGFPGSGKTTAAKALKKYARRKAYKQSIALMDMDTIRKIYCASHYPEDFPNPKGRLPKKFYTREFNQEVYAFYCEQIAEKLALGCIVVASAVFVSYPLQNQMREAAQKANAAFVGVRLEADDQTCIQRAEKRDASRQANGSSAVIDSDVDAALCRKLAANSGGKLPQNWGLVDAKRTVENVVVSIVSHIRDSAAYHPLTSTITRGNSGIQAHTAMVAVERRRLPPRGTVRQPRR